MNMSKIWGGHLPTFLKSGSFGMEWPNNASLMEVRNVLFVYNERGTIGCFKEQNKLAQMFSLLEAV